MGMRLGTDAIYAAIDGENAILEGRFAFHAADYLPADRLGARLRIILFALLDSRVSWC
jgi:hypothetical protein